MHLLTNTWQNFGRQISSKLRQTFRQALKSHTDQQSKSNKLFQNAEVLANDAVNE